MYHLAADSGCDIHHLGDVSFGTAPLTIRTDLKSYRDDASLNMKGMVEDLSVYKGRSYTACPSTEDWLDAFTMADGSAPDELYVVTMTSGLSGTYNSANVAKDLFLEKYPKAKVLVVDSLSVGPEMCLILEKIAELKQKGKTFEEVCAAVKKYCASTRLFFALKSIHNLAQNGRVNKLIAAASGVLGITMCGTANEKGQIHALGKARGDKRVIASMMKELVNAGYKGGKVRISHADNEDIANGMKAAVLEAYPAANVTVIPTRGLCSFYCERGGMCVGCETN